MLQPATRLGKPLFAVLLLGALGGAASAHAQSIRAEAGTNSACLNEWISITVTVTNPRDPVAPTAPTTDEFEFRLTTPNPTPVHQSFNINGVQSSFTNYVYRYEARPLKLRRLTVPPFTIVDGGRALQSEPIQLVVRKADATPYLICQVSTEPQDKAYVGQEVTARLDIWVRKFQQGTWDLGVEDTYKLIDMAGSSLGFFASVGSPRWGESARRGANGEKVPYYVYQFEASIFPSKPGPLELGDVEVSLLYPQRLGRDVFGRLVFSGEPRRIRQGVQPPDLQVLPIPQEGRPADFNGAVGEYSISASAKPTDVPVGDPITLTLAIRGNGVLDRLTPPKLDRVPALTRDFELSGESVAGEISNGVKQFSITLRPLRENVAAIPPIPMSYFDAKTARFGTARSEPIPLKVRSAEKIPLSALPSGQLLPGSTMTPLVEKTDGLLPNEVNLDQLLASQSPGLGMGSWAVLLGSPLVYAIALLVRRRNSRFEGNELARRRAHAYRHARQALAEARGRDDAKHVRAALLGYVADRCGLPAAGMTRADAIAELARRSAPPAARQALDELLEALEAAEYGGGGGGVAESVVSSARSVLENLENWKP